MDTSSEHRSYSRQEWGSLSIQDRIKAMNGNVDLGDHHDQQLNEDHAPQDQLLDEEGSFEEPPRRASVVEMWRRRDNKQTPVKDQKARPEEEEKKDEEPMQKDDNAAVPAVVKPSQARNMWSQRTTVASQIHTAAPKTTPVKKFGSPAPRSAMNTLAEEADVDLTIVPSPAKPPLANPEEQSTQTLPPVKKSSNVADFWARRGLKPITSDDSGSVSGSVASSKPGSVASSPWKKNDTSNHSSYSNSSVSGDKIAKPPKVSVVDRWKQRATATEETETTPEPPPPKRPISERWKAASEKAPEPPPPKKPISDRWTAAVKKPEVSPKPKSKISDRWLNQQQKSKEPSSAGRVKVDRLPPKVKTNGTVAIPAFLSSPTSRTQTTAGTTGSWPTEASTEEEDDLATAGDSTHDDQQLSVNADDVEKALTLTPKDSPHVTKRWSNRFGEEPPSVLASPMTEQLRSSPRSTPSLPAPRLKTSGKDSPSTTPENKAQQSVSGKNSSAPKTFLPDLNKISSPVVSPFKLQSEHPPPSIAMPEIEKTAPEDMSPKLLKPVSPALLKKRPGSSIKQRYENALKTKGGSDFDVADGEMVPKLLVLISGQSLNRGQSSMNQQIATILNGHNIPYEEIDGSILEMRERRNELFKISGLWAQYPQFFVKEEKTTKFWGMWDDFQQCNDSGNIAEEFSPVHIPPPLKKKASPEKDAGKSSLPSPKQTSQPEHQSIETQPIPPPEKPIESTKNDHSKRVGVSERKSFSNNPFLLKKAAALRQRDFESHKEKVQLDENKTASTLKSKFIGGRLSVAASRRVEKQVEEDRVAQEQTVEEAAVVTMLDSMSQPAVEGNQTAEAPVFAVSWPEPEQKPHDISASSTEAARPQSATLSRGPSPTPSQATTHSGASSQTSSSRRDLRNLKTRRIGKRLIEKKRELQAHRQRLKASKSTDSNDPSVPLLQNLDGQLSTSVRGEQISVPEQEKRETPRKAHGGKITIPAAFSPSNARTPMDPTPRHQALKIATDPPAKSPKLKSSSGSPNSENGLSFLDTPRSTDADSVTSRGSALSIRAEKLLKQRRQKANLADVDENSEWAEGRMHAKELTRNVLYGRLDQDKAPKSPERARRSSQLKVDTVESDLSSPVRRSGRHQNGDMYASPNRQAAFHQGDQPVDMPIDEYDHHLHGAVEAAHRQVEGVSSTFNDYSFSRPLSSSNLEGSPSMTRQRASLSSRYTTSDRFMDELDLESEPIAEPKSTKSLPSRQRSKKKSTNMESTRSAPSRHYYDDYSSTDTRENTPASSAELHSMSSQSRSRSAGIHMAHSESTYDARSEVRSFGIKEEFKSKTASDYSAFSSAYANMTFGQLAADFAGEVSNALNFERLQEDVKNVLSGTTAKKGQTVSQKSKRRMVVPDPVPFDEEDVAIEVEYMEGAEADETEPAAKFSFDSPKRGRRRRAAEV